MEILIKGEWIKPPSKDDYLDIRLYGTGEVVINGDLDREAKATLVPEHDDLVSRKAILSYFDTVYQMGADMDYEDAVAIVSNEKAIPTILERTT